MFYLTVLLDCFRMCANGDPSKVSISALAKKFHLPKTMLWKRLTRKVVGKGHQSGGKGSPHVLSSGEFNSVHVVYIQNTFWNSLCSTINKVCIPCFASEDEQELANLPFKFCHSRFPLFKKILCKLAWKCANMNGIGIFQKEREGLAWNGWRVSYSATVPHTIEAKRGQKHIS